MKYYHHLCLVVICLIQLISVTSLVAAPLPPSEILKADIIRLGEKMYRDGILPSGDTIPAFIRGDVEIDSSSFSCSSCHLRAGFGSFEGGVITPPTTGNKLYQPYRRPLSLKDVEDQATRIFYAKTVLERPAYTRESLAAALRYGIDPAKQVFNDVMPRYPLSDSDMSILISYLELLSAEPSPGASSGEFKFATIITEEVSREDRQALLEPLQNFIDKKNNQLKMYNDFIKFGYTPTIDMKSAFRSASLTVWELKGAPSTWRRQLAAYNTANPVFAVLGGISNSSWQPIHDFCEAERLPCLFPITDFPVISETGWYTYYFNKGYVQEGEAVARYLNRQTAPSPESNILQIIQESPAGQLLADGFNKGRSDTGLPAVTSVTLSAGELHSPSILHQLIKKHRPAILLLWTDAAVLQQLPDIIKLLPTAGQVYVSSTFLGKMTSALAENIRNSVYITYPYRLTPYVGPKTGGFDARVPLLPSARDFGDRRISSRSTAMLQQATLQGLNLINDNLYRDHLLDIMSMQMDLTVRDYERFSFGPGQRYASKGCYIIQLGPGDNPALLPRSEWVVQ